MKLTKMTTIDGATGAHRIPALLLLLLWFMQFRVQGLWIEWVVLDAARLFVFFQMDSGSESDWWMPSRQWPQEDSRKHTK